jgi:hypothetical protein
LNGIIHKVLDDYMIKDGGVQQGVLFYFDFDMVVIDMIPIILFENSALPLGHY